MLVLSRKQNEKIVLPGLGVTIEVLRVSGNMVKIGIDAPREINVVRGELTANVKLAEAAEKNCFAMAGNSQSEKISVRNPIRATNRPSEPMTSPVANFAGRTIVGADARQRPSAPFVESQPAVSKAAMR